ncbi:MAG: hypothetical protein EA341_07725 [Mongoliibacter sp.]|uniref:hypothetical protein n=1 Tax=Mongoliibacter sp. TaxID=2022438 RepID=UPI0012EFCD99|nr:hypothetical protein [Mongoliibacter sp.]TVP50307.1 MAG: hypothetical protein EA341_07725 [Mongoliibacter sp.]
MKKILWGALIFLAVLAFFMRVVPFLINTYLNQNADRIVSDMITRTSTFGSHEIRFGEIILDYNYKGTFLRVKDIEVTPPTLESEGKVKVKLNAERLNITGFNWYSFIFQNTISVDSAFLDNVVVVSSSPPLDSLVNENNEDKEESKKNKNGDYDDIKVGYFELRDLTVQLREDSNDSLRMSMMDMDIQAYEFSLPKEYLRDSKALFDVGSVHGTIESAEFHFDEFRQYARVEDIELDTKSGTMSIEYLGLLNKEDQYEYTAQFDYDQGWVEIDKVNMDFRGLDFMQFFRESTIEVDTVFARNMELLAFKDKRKPEDKSRRPKMLNQILEEIDQKIHIENLFLENAYIKIEERPDNDAPSAGYIYFSDVNAHATNITNISDRVEKNNEILIDASGKLMGEGSLETKITYYLDTEMHDFRLVGTLRNFNLPAVNTMIEPEAKVGIKDGKVNRLDFNIAANDYEGSGELIFRYENLEIEILNDDFESDNNLLRKLGAFVANKLVIKSNNPDKRGNLKKGNVYFMRVQHKSMFHYWWQLIFSGLKSTLTGEEISEMREKAKAERSGEESSGKLFNISFGSKDKEDKPSRKERREARRAEKEKE